MKIKENAINWIVLIVITALQNYYFKNNSYYYLKCPLVERLGDFEYISSNISVIDIFAILSPVLVFIILFTGWAEFYFKRYGITNIVRSRKILTYVARIYLKIIIYIIIFVFIQISEWFIFFVDLSDISMLFMLKQVLDYIIIIFGIAIVMLLLGIIFDKTLGILITECGLIISILCLCRLNAPTVGNVFGPLRLVFTFEGIIGVLFTILFEILIYLVTVTYVKRADII